MLVINFSLGHSYTLDVASCDNFGSYARRKRRLLVNSLYILYRFGGIFRYPFRIAAKRLQQLFYKSLVFAHLSFCNQYRLRIAVVFAAFTLRPKSLQIKNFLKALLAYSVCYGRLGKHAEYRTSFTLCKRHLRHYFRAVSHILNRYSSRDSHFALRIRYAFFFEKSLEYHIGHAALSYGIYHTVYKVAKVVYFFVAVGQNKEIAVCDYGKQTYIVALIVKVCRKICRNDCYIAL